MPALPPVITSRTNAKVKALRAALSGEARKPGDLLGLEGPNLIREAHAAGYSFDTLYLREGDDRLLEHGPWLEELRVRHRVVLDRQTFGATVTTHSPQGVAATCILQQPAARPARSLNTLVLERIQDPGNLGTLLRSAESFGVGRVMVTPDTANQWNPKVLRAGAGSVLRMPVLRAHVDTHLEQLRAEGIRIFAAVAHFSGPTDRAAPHGVLMGRRSNEDAPNDERYRGPSFKEGPAVSLSHDTDFEHPCAILIGNEGSGLSAEALRMADEQVMIAGYGGESLNAAVAGSILMYESMRQVPLRAWARHKGLRP